MTRASGKILSVRTLLILALMLMWSGFAMCGEIHEAVKKNDTAKVKELVIYLYRYSFPLNSGKAVKSLTLPVNADVAIAAISLLVN